MKQTTVFLALLASLNGLLGCNQINEIQVLQPFAPPAQQSLELTSRWAWTASIEGRRAYLLEFPLPAAKSGNPAFRVYLEAPDGHGSFPLAPTESGGARAFFVQEVGQLRGKVVLRSGTIDVAPVAWRPLLRQLDLDLTADNGFQLAGQVVVQPGDREMQRFLREFRPDVTALRELVGSAPTSQPAAEEPSEVAPVDSPADDS